MRFEWDDNKNKSNFDKHGIWFEEAQTAWMDANSVEFFDPDHSHDKEDRFIRIGLSAKLNLLVVIFCEQDGAGVIRIISARYATKKEYKQYEE